MSMTLPHKYRPSTCAGLDGLLLGTSTVLPPSARSRTYRVLLGRNTLMIIRQINLRIKSPLSTPYKANSTTVNQTVAPHISLIVGGLDTGAGST